MWVCGGGGAGLEGIGGLGTLSRHQLSVILHTAGPVVFVKGSGSRLINSDSDRNLL